MKKLLGIVVLLIFVGSVLLFITSSNSGLLDIFKTKDCDGTNYPNCYCQYGTTGNAADKYNEKQQCLKRGGKEEPLSKFDVSQNCARVSEQYAKEVRKEVYKECMKDAGF